MNSQVYNFLAIINTALGGKTIQLQEPDWAKLLAYAKSHNIIPLLYEGCSKYTIFNSAGDEIRKKLFMDTLNKITGQISRTQVFLNIYDQFIIAGLKPLVLKGLACRSLYGDMADHRPSKDEDIYIKKEEFVQYRNLLEQNGFVMEDALLTDEIMANISEVSFYHKSGFVLEVHVNLMRKINPINIRINACFEDAFDNCISNNVNGHQIYTMSPTKCYLYLFLHFYKHFITYGIGLRQMLDLLLYGDRYKEMIDWTIVEKHIHDLSADKLYADILIIGSTYFDINIETGFSGYKYELLLEDIMNAGVFGKSSAERRIGGNMTIAAMNNGAPHYIAMLFPSKKALQNKYKQFYIKRGQLPMIWVKRLFRFFRYNFNIRILFKSIKIGRRRSKLLRNYGIIN
jgi:hypothetical protein